MHVVGFYLYRADEGTLTHPEDFKSLGQPRT
jgi:hypothetical protein